MIVNSNEVHSIDSPLPNETIVLQIPLNCLRSILPEEQLYGFPMSGQKRRTIYGAYQGIIRNLL